MLFLLACLNSTKQLTKKESLDKNRSSKETGWNKLKVSIHNGDFEEFESELKKMTGLDDLTKQNNRDLRRTIRHRDKQGNTLLHHLHIKAEKISNTSISDFFNQNFTEQYLDILSNWLKIFTIVDIFARYDQKNNKELTAIQLSASNHLDSTWSFLAVALFASKSNLRKRFNIDGNRRTVYLSSFFPLDILRSFFVLTAYGFRYGRRSRGQRRLRANFAPNGRSVLTLLEERSNSPISSVSHFAKTINSVIKNGYDADFNKLLLNDETMMPFSIQVAAVQKMIDEDFPHLKDRFVTEIRENK